MLPMTSSFDLTPGCTPMNKTWEYHTGTLSYGDPLGGGVGSMTYPSLVCSCLLPSWGLWPGSIYPTSVSWDLVSYHPLSTVPPPPSIHGVPRYSLFYSELSWFYQYYLCFDLFFPTSVIYVCLYPTQHLALSSHPHKDVWKMNKANMVLHIWNTQYFKDKIFMAIW